MCGRYTYKLSWAEIVALYRLTLPDEPPERLRPSYNVAPTQVMPIIRPAGNGRELVLAAWGLVPFWLKPDQLGKQPYATINARSDRIQTAPTYREPFKKRRCLVPASRDAALASSRARTGAPRLRTPSPPCVAVERSSKATVTRALLSRDTTSRDGRARGCGVRPYSVLHASVHT